MITPPPFTASTRALDRGVVSLARAAVRLRRALRRPSPRPVAPEPRLAPAPARLLLRPTSDARVHHVIFAPDPQLDLPREPVARWTLAPGDRPLRRVIIVVHGYNAGDPALEARVWPFCRLAEARLDVVQVTLPDHAHRRPRGQALPRWPDPDHLATTARFIDDAVRELTTLISALEARGDVDVVGVWGMSLGAYVAGAALGILSRERRRLPFFGAITPLFDLADLLVDQRLLDPAALGDAARLLTPRGPRALSWTTPALVVAAAQDGVTTQRQALAYAGALDAPVVWIEGSHLAPIGLGRAFEALLAATTATASRVGDVDAHQRATTGAHRANTW